MGMVCRGRLGGGEFSVWLCFFAFALCVGVSPFPARRRWVKEERGGGEDKDANQREGGGEGDGTERRSAAS